MFGKRPNGRSPDGKKLEKQTFVVFDPTLTGMQGYNTFRIPAVVSFHKWIFAFCEGRRDTHKDFGSIDIILRRAQISGKDKTLNGIKT
ncbi:hypothetical protein BSL78_20990 [Apostichopus japonicus]|uniref:Uncharacterized protein n=1 Tax=Stichopus japonicus TaxID=307972 RepID=A0A2G8K2D5_STIJA|nr:hypothetical protein BSL78_20990 [Apostichopus japonicus]